MNIYSGQNKYLKKIRMNIGRLNLITFVLTFCLIMSFFPGCKGPVFEISVFKINPAVSVSGDPVTVIAVVDNSGDKAGSYEINLSVDGVIKETEEISIEASQSKTVSFVLYEAIGTHNVDINGSSGKFEVRRFLGIITSSIPKARRGEEYEYILEAQGGIPPYTWKWDLPSEMEQALSNEEIIKWSGLSLTEDGIIRGRATSSGKIPSDVISCSMEKQIVITVVDSNGNSVSKKMMFGYFYER